MQVDADAGHAEGRRLPRRQPGVTAQASTTSGAPGGPASRPILAIPEEVDRNPKYRSMAEHLLRVPRGGSLIPVYMPEVDDGDADDRGDSRT